MNIQSFINTWEGVSAENKWLRLLCLLLVIINGVLVVNVMRKDVVQTLVPYTLTNDAWISSTEGSRSYKESWAHFFANTLGNISPDNIDFVVARIIPFLDVDIKTKYEEELYLQSAAIKEDKINIRFEIKRILFEKTTNKVFVTGFTFESGAGGKEKRTEQTYEFKITVQTYAPKISHFSVYKGIPKTKEEIKKRENKKSKSERN